MAKTQSRSTTAGRVNLASKRGKSKSQGFGTKLPELTGVDAVRVNASNLTGKIDSHELRTSL
jgi:hypothetical protein